MFVDACAIIAVLSNEPEATRVSNALAGSNTITSPVAVLEAALGLARPDKFGLSVSDAKALVLEYLAAVSVQLVDLPPAALTIDFSADAATRFGKGKHRLNLGDCLHYACARHYSVPILATADEFRNTDIGTVP